MEATAAGSSKNWGGASDDDGAPESWEAADWEKSVKTLVASSNSSSVLHVEDCNAAAAAAVAAIENLEADVSLLSLNGCGAPKGGDEVDGFLREALQNPRDRLTILRLEQEVERFMRSTKQQQLEFQPMPSSYLRLVAHRVAQHYCLQSMVIDSGSIEGSRIVARKTPESKYPITRLSDIPVDPSDEERPVALPMPKVAIKQRPSKGSRANGDDLGGPGGNRLNPAKTVEERKEEYNKARARIFSSQQLSAKIDSGELEVVPLDESRLVECYSVEDIIKVPDDKYKSVVEMPADRTSPVRVFQEFESGEGRNKELTEKESFNRAKVNSSSSSRVAIFRDREKDRKDPDYDRNYDRYSQRFEPGFGMGAGSPYGMQAIYTPLVNYNTEFPQLAGPRPQMHMEPPPPPPIPQQRMQRPPWGNPGNMTFRAPDPLMAPVPPGHMGPHSAMAMYMPAPQYAYQGHSLAYMHHPDRFQQSLSQSHPQQPDGNYNHARRR